MGKLQEALADFDRALERNPRMVEAYVDRGGVRYLATGTWSNTGSLNIARTSHTATLLPNGKVLIAGGASTGGDLTSAELYDPATGTWSTTGHLNTSRWLHTATLLPNGKVLVVGGWTGINRAELYDPTTERWNDITGPHTGRFWHTATRLLNGKVLVMGWGRPEMYDPVTGIWGGVALPDQRVGFGSTATLLLNGKVLVMCGNSAELFDPGPSESETVTSVSAASYRVMGLASEAIISSFGARLATATQTATTIPLPTSLAGTTMKVKDSAGVERLAPLIFVSPTQVNYQIPQGTAAGAATVTITSGDGTVSTGVALVKAVAPSQFAAHGNGQGVAAALALRIKADGSQSYELVAQFDAAQNRFVARPLDLGPETDTTCQSPPCSRRSWARTV